MASKHDVKIAIKARDEASKKFKTIGSAAGGMTSMLKKAALAATAYFSARAVYSFSKKSVLAAAEQQKADAMLAQSLANVGYKSDAALQSLKAFAGEIQKDTIYGDEYTEQIMALGLNLGLTGKQIKEATKGAIGLTAALGGKMALEDAIKNVAAAYQGEFTMLNRYVFEMRKVKTNAEKMAILQRKMADGYKMAKVEAQKGLGPVTQMWNALGDAVNETIGAILLPKVQESANKIKQWAIDNQANINKWATKTIAVITLIKDVFMEFLKFMKNDWRTGLDFAFDATLESFKTLGKNILIVAEKISDDMLINTAVWAQRSAARLIDQARFARQDWMASQDTGLSTKERHARANAYGKQMVDAAIKSGVYETAFPSKETISWQQVGSQLKANNTDLLNHIKDKMPENLGKAFGDALEKYRKKLETAKSPAGDPAAVDPFAPGSKKIGVRARILNAVGNALMIQKTMMAGLMPGAMMAMGIGGQKTIGQPDPALEAKEARFLTFAPGKRFGGNKVEKNTKESATGIKELVKQTDQMVKYLKAMSSGSQVIEIAEI